MNEVSVLESLTCLKQTNWLLGEEKEQERQNVDLYLPLATVAKCLLRIQRCLGRIARRYRSLRRADQKGTAVLKLRLSMGKSQ